MISICQITAFKHRPIEIFQYLENIEKLSVIKKDIGPYSIARDEHGLQIIDSVMRFPFFITARGRFKYTTMPGKSAELKLLKGGMRQFICTYSLSDRGGETGIEARLRMSFPYTSPGFVLSFLIAPLMKRRIAREFKLLEKLIATG